MKASSERQSEDSADPSHDKSYQRHSSLVTTSLLLRGLITLSERPDMVSRGRQGEPCWQPGAAAVGKGLAWPRLGVRRWGAGSKHPPCHGGAWWLPGQLCRHGGLPSHLPLRPLPPWQEAAAEVPVPPPARKPARRLVLSDQSIFARVVFDRFTKGKLCLSYRQEKYRSSCHTSWRCSRMTAQISR